MASKVLSPEGDGRTFAPLIPTCQCPVPNQLGKPCKSQDPIVALYSAFQKPQRGDLSIDQPQPTSSFCVSNPSRRVAHRKGAAGEGCAAIVVHKNYFLRR